MVAVGLAALLWSGTAMASDGWQGLKWGSTETQAKALFGDRMEPAKALPCSSFYDGAKELRAICKGVIRDTFFVSDKFYGLDYFVTMTFDGDQKFVRAFAVATGEVGYDRAKSTLAAMSAKYGTGRSGVIEGTTAEVIWKDGATFVNFSYHTDTDVLAVDYVSAAFVQAKAAHSLLNGR